MESNESKARKVLELRKRFRLQQLTRFLEVIEIVGLDHPDYLIKELELAEEEARTEEARRQVELEEVLARIKVSEMHHRLGITVPKGVDLEHAQAILIYAFVMPGRQVIYAESHRLSLEPIRMRVRNKLFGFNADKFIPAFDLLVTHGVLLLKKESQGTSYSLNLKARGATDYGRRVIEEVKRFVREEKR